MDKYRAEAPLTIPVGSLLGLSDSQAEARAYGVVREGKAWRVRLPVQFKAGEEFGYEGELPKALAELVDTPPRRGKAKPPADPPADGPGPDDPPADPPADPAAE